MDIMRKIEQVGIVPVVKLNDVNKAFPLAKALLEGGISVAEVTFRTDCAGEVIKTISENCPEMLVGAGTIINVDQAKKAIECGAKFIVSPGFSKDIVLYCKEQNVPVIPGCVTPSEIMAALECGIDIIKFFPAKEYGGLNTMKSLSGPFAQVRFMPTGGISLENLKEYISAKFIVACGGTYMVKDNLIDQENYAEITRLSKLSTDIVKEERR